jgi:hypothetical protein
VGVYLSPVSPLCPSRTLLRVALLRYRRVPCALQTAGTGGGQHALPDLGPCAAAAGPAALGPVRPGGPVRAGVRAARPLLSCLTAAANAASAPAQRTLTLAVPCLANSDRDPVPFLPLDPGSGIRDPGRVKSQGPDPGSGMNNPDHIRA